VYDVYIRTRKRTHYTIHTVTHILMLHTQIIIRMFTVTNVSAIVSTSTYEYVYSPCVGTRSVQHIPLQLTRNDGIAVQESFNLEPEQEEVSYEA
jgi:hypothetical protein